jgi:hypothetical protein
MFLVEHILATNASWPGPGRRPATSTEPAATLVRHRIVH